MTQPPGGEPVAQLASALFDCMNQVNPTNPSPVARVEFRVGTEVAHDMDQVNDLCCEGLGYVMLGDSWLSSNSFPEEDINRQATARCMPPSWGIQLKYGLVRCVPTGGADGSMPTAVQWNDAAYQNFYDAEMLRNVACCFRSWFTSQVGFFDGMSIVIGRQIQANPNGGCVERYQTISVQFPNCC